MIWLRPKASTTLSSFTDSLDIPITVKEVQNHKNHLKYNFKSLIFCSLHYFLPFKLENSNDMKWAPNISTIVKLKLYEMYSIGYKTTWGNSLFLRNFKLEKAF